MSETNFKCLHCHKIVSLTAPGTKNRNHCPFCLYSVHLDAKIPGDRGSTCGGLMKPIGLKIKAQKTDKYSGKPTGEVMLIHKCTKCGTESANRIAGDDNETAILSLAAAHQLDFVKFALLGNTQLVAL